MKNVTTRIVIILALFLLMGKYSLAQTHDNGSLTLLELQNNNELQITSAEIDLEAGNNSEEVKVLVYTKNGKGFVHGNIQNSVNAIRRLGEKHGFDVEHSEDPLVFTEKNLDQYAAIIFSNTNNETIDTQEQKEAFQRYIRSGGGFVGIHSASGSEREWPWYWKLVGGKFKRHAPRQDFTVHVIEKDHLSTSFLPDPWQIEEDECYYLDHLNPGIRVLVAADLTTVKDEKKSKYPGQIFGDKFPIAWYHEFEGGRSWYTALGHRPVSYSNPVFMRHILGGIQWVVNGTSD